MNAKPELLAPAGSFETAVYALRNGADAVYLGLKEFSARKSAVNFTFDQLRRLKKFAAENRKKIYIAINTVITETEIPRIYTAAKILTALDPDGVIIQDLGMLKLFRARFPGIPLHASTQMGIHTADGIRFLKREGIKRVVLARELSVSEIAEVKREVPEMELEVFIHGALCYSFSGQCFASGVILGRSANRGDCGGICRTWFNNGTEKSYFFSMKDLAAYRQLEPLIKAGVSSFKIEGRMKSPEYTGLASEIYRKLIDGKLSPADWEKSSISLKTVFSRPQTDTWISGNFKTPSVCRSYPSHRGVKAGTVSASGQGTFTMKLETGISVRDGLLFFSSGEKQKPVKFGVKKMYSASGNPVTEGETGETVIIAAQKTPAVSSEIYKISSHSLNWPMINEQAFPMWRKEIKFIITLTGESMTVSADTGSGICSLTRKVTVEKGNNPKDFKSVLTGLFKKSGESMFTCGSLEFRNMTDLNNDGIFIPPKELKSIKRDFYVSMNNLVYSESDQAGKSFQTGDSRNSETGIDRSLLVPKTGSPVPFALFNYEFRVSGLCRIDGKTYLPLMPVTFNSTEYLEKLIEIIESNSDRLFVLGLNNVTHLEWTGKLSEYSNVSFFIDYGLYIANSYSYRFYTERVPKLEFCYFWIEGSKDEYNTLVSSLGDIDIPLFFIGTSFKPHLFVSRSCHTNGLNNGKCPADCGKDFEYPVSQGKRKFRVVVKDCITWLFDGA